MSLGTSMALKEMLTPSDEIDTTVVNTFTVPARIRVVHALTNSANNAYTITLGPPEVEAGLHKTIFMTSRNSTDDITVAGEGFSNITLNAAAEYTLLYSDGKDWMEVGLNHS